MGQTHLAGAVAVPLMSDSRDSHPQPPSKRVCPQGRASRAGDRAQAGGRVGKGCVCVSVCPCVSVRASLGLYVYAYMCTCVRASTCVYICVHVRVYLRVCVCGAVCGWVCVCGKTCLSGFSGQGARPLSLLCGLATGVSQPLSALCPHQTSPLAGHAPARLPHPDTLSWARQSQVPRGEGRAASAPEALASSCRDPRHHRGLPRAQEQFQPICEAWT